jgi:hypothetical protein
MKKYLLLFLFPLGAFAQSVQFRSFDQSQFDTNGLTIRVKVSAFSGTNFLGDVYVTNFFATNITVNNFYGTNVFNVFNVSSNLTAANIQGTTN